MQIEKEVVGDHTITISRGRTLGLYWVEVSVANEPRELEIYESEGDAYKAFVGYIGRAQCAASTSS